MIDEPTNKVPRTTDEMLVEILNRLEGLEASVDQRLKKTTPLTAQLAELRERMETGFRESKERNDRLEREFLEFGIACTTAESASRSFSEARTAVPLKVRTITTASEAIFVIGFPLSPSRISQSPS